jgi:hypothetical protein
MPEPVDTPDDWATTSVDDLVDVPDVPDVPQVDDWGDVAL